MQERVQKRQKRLFSLVDARLAVGIIGLIMSVVLHELFHIIVHWDHITHMQLFPGSGAIFEVIATVPQGYNVDAEEAIAYAITATVLLMTAVIICKIHDARDTRTLEQIIFPKGSSFHPSLELMNRVLHS